MKSILVNAAFVLSMLFGEVLAAPIEAEFFALAHDNNL